MDPARMVRLVTVGGAFEGKVLAAQLGAEGIVCELRGGVDGPYPFGPVHVFVEAPRVDEARALLAAEPFDAGGDDDDTVGFHPSVLDDPDAASPRRLSDRPPLALVLVLVSLLALAGASIYRVVSAAQHGGGTPPPSTVLP